MRLTKALEQIANDFDLGADELITYANENTIGGYHSDRRLEKWPIGSMWGVEGQILYTLIRATKPKVVVELGSLYGCSTAHILAALEANDNGGQLISVDNRSSPLEHEGEQPVVSFDVDHEFIETDAVKWIENEMPSRRVDFVFEDLDHRPETVKAIWKSAMDKIKKNAFIVSHDAMHYIVGDSVRQGILAAGADAIPYLIEPSDCGLAIWRKS